MCKTAAEANKENLQGKNRKLEQSVSLVPNGTGIDSFV
jgi:hypothetical protein